MPRRERGLPRAFTMARKNDRRLGPWMTRNHDLFLHEFGARRIDWTMPMLLFEILSLTSDHGNPISREIASRTWRRVRLAVAEVREAKARARPEPGELVPGVRLVASAAAATPIRAVPTPIPAAAPIAGASPGAIEATEHIAAVLAAMGASRVALPPLPSREPQPAPNRPAPDKDPTP